MTTHHRRRTTTLAGVAGMSLVLTLAACSDVRAGKADAGSLGAGGSSTYLGLPVEKVRSASVLHDGSGVGIMVAQQHPPRLWVGGVDRLSWIDPRDQSVHRTDSHAGVSVFFAAGSLYRAAYFGGDVARYDVSGPVPREVARVRAPSPVYVSADRNGVWVTDHDGGRLIRLDKRTLARRSVLQLGPRAGGYRHALAGMVEGGRGRLWVLSERDERVYEVDTATGRAVRHVQLGARPTDQLVRNGTSLWVMLSRGENQDDADLELVDLASGRVVTRVVTHDAAFVTHANKMLIASPPVVVHGQVWVPSDEHLVHLDAAHGWKPDRVLALPVPGMFARNATVAFGSLWIHTSLPKEEIVRVPLRALD